MLCYKLIFAYNEPVKTSSKYLNKCPNINTNNKPTQITNSELVETVTTPSSD